MVTWHSTPPLFKGEPTIEFANEGRHPAHMGHSTGNGAFMPRIVFEPSASSAKLAETHRSEFGREREQNRRPRDDAHQRWLNQLNEVHS